MFQPFGNSTARAWLRAPSPPSPDSIIPTEGEGSLNAKGGQLSEQSPLESNPDLGHTILRTTENLRRFQQAPIFNEAAAVRAASSRKSSSTIPPGNSGQDIEPEANDHDFADYMLSPDVGNPPCLPPAVSSDAAPSATSSPPLSPPPPSPPPPPAVAASSDVAATSAPTRVFLGRRSESVTAQTALLLQQQEQDTLQAELTQQALLNKLQVQLTQLRAEQEEAGSVKRKPRWTVLDTA